MTTNTASVHLVITGYYNSSFGFTNAVTAYSFTEGQLVLVLNRQKYLENNSQLSSNAISAAYFTKPYVNLDKFLNKNVSKDTTVRDESRGIYRLHGSFNVESWKSELDYQIRLKMQSSGSSPVAVNGLLIEYYDQMKFRPLRWSEDVLDSF